MSYQELAVLNTILIASIIIVIVVSISAIEYFKQRAIKSERAREKESEDMRDTIQYWMARSKKQEHMRLQQWEDSVEGSNLLEEVFLKISSAHDIIYDAYDKLYDFHNKESDEEEDGGEG